MPYELVWIVGLYLYSPDLHPFIDELVERERIPFFSLWFSILIDPVRCRLSTLLVWCLLRSFDSRRLLGRVDQRKANLVFFSFGSFVLKPLYVCTQLDHSISMVLAVTTAPLRTLGCLSAFSAPRSWYPTSGLGTRVLLCVAPFRCLVLCHGMCIGRSRPLPLLFSPCSTLSWFSSITMAYGLRETRTV